MSAAFAPVEARDTEQSPQEATTRALCALANMALGSSTGLVARIVSRWSDTSTVYSLI